MQTELPTYTDWRPDWSLIPIYMVGALQRYIENGIEPGSFLSSLLCNDLRGTFMQADSTNSQHVRDYLQFLYMYSPAECWGSKEKYIAWIKQGGLGVKDIAP